VFRLRDGIYNVLSISTLGNQYIQANKPWDLLKGSDEDRSVSADVRCFILLRDILSSTTVVLLLLLYYTIFHSVAQITCNMRLFDHVFWPDVRFYHRCPRQAKADLG